MNFPPGPLHPSNKNHIQYVDQRCGAVFPWYSYTMLEELAKWDTRDWTVFEYGSGFSTLWYALNCKHVISVDHDSKWHGGVSQYLGQLGISTVSLRLRKANVSDPVTPQQNNEGGNNSEYVAEIDTTDCKYDLIIIDGVHRNDCAKRVLRHVKDGGIVIHDNFNQKSIGADNRSTETLFKDFDRHDCLHPAKNEPYYPTDWMTTWWKVML